MRRWRELLASAAVAAVACQVPPERVTLRLELPQELSKRTAQLRTLPAIAEARRESAGGVIALELKQAAGKVTLQLPGACPLTVDTRELKHDQLTTRRFEPLFDVGPSERIVGLARELEIVAKPRCSSAQSAKTSFSVEGGGLEAIQLEPRRLRAKTPSAPLESPHAHGIVPISARVKQQLTSRVVFRAELNGNVFEQALTIAAVARSSGLPNVGLLHPLLLSNDAWRLFDRPLDSGAELRAVGAGLSELLPDVPGRYRLVDRDGLELSIQTGRFDRMPLDCGRAGCHADIARSAQSSPMTRVLSSDLGGCHSLENPVCAVACHTTGEPGTRDGGFAHVASELQLGALPADFEDLPRDLQRLGGVGCLACHGPAAIPEPSARFNVLRSDVCAVCHDAPPRYNHVQALASSRMGHADGDRTTREGNCARCHTSWGALGRPAPPAFAQGDGFGITCSTCHDVHPRAPAVPPAETHAGLLRAFDLPSTLPSPPAAYSGVSQVCIACHAPTSTTGLPEASAALIVAGRGGHDPASGRALELPAPHAANAKGCLACHQNVEGGVLGKGHDFRATSATCERCHTQPRGRDPSVAARARELLEQLAPELSRPARGVWHTQTAPAKLENEHFIALRNVLLVLEDPAADVHHPRYATALLDAAASVTGGARR